MLRWLRLMVHWSCELFDDMADVRRHFARAGELSHDEVIARFAEDLRRSGVAFELPSDPLGDARFRALLEGHCGIRPPEACPAEAVHPTRGL